MNRALIAGAVLVASLVSGGMLIESDSLTEPSAAPASPRLLEQVMTRLRRDYIDTIDADAMFRMAATGVVREVDERYSALLTPERVTRLRESAAGRYAGIGVEIDMRDGFVTVITPIAASPADSAGIDPGDRMMAIDGKPTHDLTMDEIQQALRGPVGSTVTLTVARDGDAEMGRTFTLRRREIVYHAVRRVGRIAPSVGYVELVTFSEDAARDLTHAVESLFGPEGRRPTVGTTPSRSPLSSLILDLRENPGGLLEQGVAVADLFLDAGKTIAQVRGRTSDANREFTDATRERWPGIPLVVLVDSGTASAAEIVAGALKDNERALVVGAPTYGKGSAQSLLPLPSGYALKLTTARWFTPDGRIIERDSTAGGIEPDVVVRNAGKVALSLPDTGRTQGTVLLPLPSATSDAAVARAVQLLDGVKTPAQLRSRIPR